MIIANASATRSRRSSSARCTRSSGSKTPITRVRLVAAERRPEGAVAARRAQRVDERGVEPGAAALGRDVERRARAADGEEHLDGLGEAEDAAEQRDRVAGEAVGVAGAVPVLVERCGSPPRSSPVSSIMRAMSAPRSQRSSVISRAPSAPLRAIAASRRVRPWRSTWRSDAPGRMVVDQLARALELEVVGAEQRAQPGGVARAAGVLEQQRVEQRRALVGREPDLLADPHADRARAHGVAHRLALGDVERVREGGDHLGEPDVHQEGIGGPRAAA